MGSRGQVRGFCARRPRIACQPSFSTLKRSHIPSQRLHLQSRHHPHSTLSGSGLVGSPLSGGVAPGYFINPLRGSSEYPYSPCIQQPGRSVAY
jgi:hypothetical protein